MRKTSISIFLLSLLLAWSLPMEVKSQPNGSDSALQKRVEQLLENKNVRVGVAVNYHGKMICRINATQSFPMMSVFKLHQAVSIISRIQHDSLAFGRSVFITKAMLNPDTYSPLRDKYPEGNIHMSIGELLEYSVALSDNNASNILFSMYDGPQFVHHYVQGVGCKNTQIKWTEEDMGIEHSRAYDNSTTPDDAIAMLEFLNDETSDNNRLISRLKEIMSDTKTGKDRLAKYLPDNATLYHKTGTGYVKQDGTLMAINDIGFVVLPGGSHYSIAVFCSESKMSEEDTEELIAEISKLSYEYIRSVLKP